MPPVRNIGRAVFYIQNKNEAKTYYKRRKTLLLYENFTFTLPKYDCFS